MLKHGKHVLPGARDTLALLANKGGQFTHPVPYLLMTNGGGMTEADRLVALERDFGLPVRIPSSIAARGRGTSRAHKLRKGEVLTIQLTSNQLVQSHTPLRDYVAKYADRPVLVCGGKGDAARRIARSYGLNRPYLLQDIVAWRGSVWDRYELSEEEEGFVQVCAPSPFASCNAQIFIPQSTPRIVCHVMHRRAECTAGRRLCFHTYRSDLCNPRRRSRLGARHAGHHRDTEL